VHVWPSTAVHGCRNLYRPPPIRVLLPSSSSHSRPPPIRQLLFSWNSFVRVLPPPLLWRYWDTSLHFVNIELRWPLGRAHHCDVIRGPYQLSLAGTQLSVKAFATLVQSCVKSATCDFEQNQRKFSEKFLWYFHHSVLFSLQVLSAIQARRSGSATSQSILFLQLSVDELGICMPTVQDANQYDVRTSEIILLRGCFKDQPPSSNIFLGFIFVLKYR